MMSVLPSFQFTRHHWVALQQSHNLFELFLPVHTPSPRCSATRVIAYCSVTRWLFGQSTSSSYVIATCSATRHRRRQPIVAP